MDRQETQVAVDWGAKAQEAYAAEQAKLAEERAAIRARDMQESQSILLKMLESVLGVTDGYTLDTSGDRAMAWLDGISNLTFYATRRHGGNLYAKPRLVVPEGPEYENWQKNPANLRIVEDLSESEGAFYINSWNDVGWLMTRTHIVTPKPWPQRPPAPKRYAWLTEEQMNEQRRRFVVLQNTVYDPDLAEPVVLVEFLEGEL